MIFQFALNGDFVDSYETVKKAAENNNIFESGIRAVIRGKQDTYKGFYWSKGFKKASKMNFTEMNPTMEEVKKECELAQFALDVKTRLLIINK